MRDCQTDYAESAYEAGYDADTFVKIIGGLLTHVGKNLKDPFKFAPYHQAVRDPFDFYEFGNNFVRTLVKWEESYVTGEDKLAEIRDLIKQGDNIILLANHQTEADPQVSCWQVAASPTGHTPASVTRRRRGWFPHTALTPLCSLARAADHEFSLREGQLQ